MKSETFAGKWIILFVFVSLIAACKTPPVPPEVEQAKSQENELWRAGAPIYAAEEYAQYLESVRLAKDKLIKERAKIRWFRKYEQVAADFQAILACGNELIRKVQEEKESVSRDFSQSLSLLGERIGKLKVLTQTMNENDRVRKNLTQAELVSREAEVLLRKEKYKELPGKIKTIDTHIDQAVSAVFSILARYADEAQVEKWRKWAMETVNESRKKGITILLINKLERTLTVYKKGKAVAVYEIGLGRYGLSDKLYAGDEATPEGKYKVVKKNPWSRYYKALLIDYPNNEDKRSFSRAKKEGLIAPRAGIGGLIEIHGGGNDSLTNGCIAVQDDVMDRLFPEVSVGTPVTIIGSLENAEKMLASLRKS